MIIALAQTRPIAGQVETNISNHIKHVTAASTYGANVLFFAELSLTGYEPTLAQDLAMNLNDPRLQAFQKLATDLNLTIGVGVPTPGILRPQISSLIYDPSKQTQLYSKQYLHPDEEPFFEPGSQHHGIIGDTPQLAIAICYELSIPGHALSAFNNGAKGYLASVAKTSAGVASATKRLATIAKAYSAPTFMVNCVGPTDNFISAGLSAVWDSSGQLLAQLDNTEESMLFFDTSNQVVMIHRF